jgi:hypothetical protein
MEERSESNDTVRDFAGRRFPRKPIIAPVEEFPEVLPARPPMPIPADFDVETERRRTKQGGCCHSQET